MPIQAPNLDDRTFDQLIAEAWQQVNTTCPAWTDRTESDPGTVLVELFAYLTEALIYRLNRLPNKAYIEFLRLLGVTMHPPAAASVGLTFTLAKAAAQDVVIPRFTRISTAAANGSTPQPVFASADELTIAAGKTSITGTAYHSDQVQYEDAGVGTGQPGQVIRVARPPIVAPTGDPLDLVVGVELGAGETQPAGGAFAYGGKNYGIWREVETFAEPGPDRSVYIVDRATGTVLFAPALQVELSPGRLDDQHPLADVPAAGRSLRLSYRTGGGVAGNVPAGTLTVLKDPVPGVQVTNPQAASGGQAAETLENALQRGPQELHTPRRAVTARDYEAVAAGSGGVARASAHTALDLWQHAPAGGVLVLLVPTLPDGTVATPQALAAQETDAVRRQVAQAIAARQPLGAQCTVDWTRYKTVSVAMRIVVRREEQQAAVQARVRAALNQAITPVPATQGGPAWPFGDALRVSKVYDIALAEPGVRWVDGVQLKVDQAPDGDVFSIAADCFQPTTWHAASGDTVFRSLNGGDGWEAVLSLGGNPVRVVRASHEHPGHVACAGWPAAGGSVIQYSTDCGETWTPGPQTAFRIFDVAWTTADGVPALLLASDAGLHQLKLGETPVPINVDPANPSRPFWAVAVTPPIVGAVNIAVAAQNMQGVFLSSDGGHSFRQSGLTGQDVRTLAYRHDGARDFLWAGVTVPGGTGEGSGCFERELLRPGQDPPEGWQPRSTAWTGGSCHAIAFAGQFAFAASHRRGILRLDLAKPGSPWVAPGVGSGLPLNHLGDFAPLLALASDRTGDRPGSLVMAAGPADEVPVGVFRSAEAIDPANAQPRWTFCASRVFPAAGGIDRVTLPASYLFCSGAHTVDVVVEDGPGGH